MKKKYVDCLQVAVLAAGTMSALVGIASAQFSNGGNGLNSDTTIYPAGAGVATTSLNPANAVSSAQAQAQAATAKSAMPTTSVSVMPLDLTGTIPSNELPGVEGSSPSKGSQAYGTATEQWPYSHQRVAIYGAPGPGSYSFQVPVTSKPYRFSGKLYTYYDASGSNPGTYVCSASLIKRGLLVTAAHCVYRFGDRGPTSIWWIPANYASYGGAWTQYNAAAYTVPLPYQNGTDTCQNGAIGVVCNNDIALVRLNPKGSVHAGAAMGGWFRYGTNGYSFTASPAFGGHTIASITQLGYPVAFDSGYQMQRNNSMGKYITTTSTNTGQLLKNVQLGSSLSGGSSGGPWMVNFGTYPVLTDPTDASYGMQPQRNTVIATTSWGYLNKDINVQGASWFGQNYEYPNASYGAYGAGNIGAMLQAACTASPAHC